MSVLTNQFLMDLESNMRLITENTYTALAQNQWWTKVAKEMPSRSKKERINWLIETAYLAYGVEGQQEFMDLAMQTTEFEAQYFTGPGLRMLKSQLEDLDGNGVEVAAAWSRTMGALAANFPQQETARAINQGTAAASLAYDGVVFFHDNAGGTTGHPLDPTQVGNGRFANLFTNVASANNPGACPIGGVTVDVAVANLNKALTYIANIPQPNGVNPRKLKGKYLFVPKALHSSALEATKTKFIAKAAASGGGSGDIAAVVDMFGLEVVPCEELGAIYGGSDTAYYIGCEDIMSGQLGALTYVNREAFNIGYNGPQTDAQLARMREFEWIANGRSVVGYGHPYQLFKVLAT